MALCERTCVCAHTVSGHTGATAVSDRAACALSGVRAVRAALCVCYTALSAAI